ncbi:MAG: ThuA domain-containing protein [Planctomycetota bacterium]
MSYVKAAWTLLLAVCTIAGQASAHDAIRVLIADGPQKFHKNEDTTPVLKEILEKDGRFHVDLSRSTAESCKDGSYHPDFSQYDVVVMNEGFGANPWPEATMRAFEAYMANGGGMVTYHAANNSWPDWVEYNKMTGLGGWGGRNEKSGPYLYINDAGETVRDTSPGRGGAHGPQHEYELTVRTPEHPIMQGLPTTFKHGPDELYDRLRGPAENVTILATAYSAKDKGGTGRHEPMLMTITYGQGRVFHTTLGHHVKQIKEGSFVTTFLRGTEWAATGQVTIPVPEDFPNQKFE